MTKFRSQLFQFASCILLLLTCRATAQSQFQTFGAVPETRIARLRHGINASQWFAQVYDPKGYSKEHFQTWTTAQDIALIKAMGFDHVRLSINPQPMFRPGQADQIPPEYLAYLDAAVQMILDQGLAVILDIHPDDDFKAKLANNDEFVEQFTDFWRGFAKHYSRLDPDRVFFEIINEPEVRDRYRWSGIQTKLAAAIRESAPQYTIIATGARWSDDDDLVFLDPLRDPNVIYTFHFYLPHLFTHQGATWSVNFWHEITGLSYPSAPGSAQKAASHVPDDINQLYVLRYGMEHWDAARIQMEIGFVAQWAKRRGLPLICDEFGVYRAYADPRDRAQWIADVRTALEENAIGWTMWDYSGGFGVVTKSAGQTQPDEITLRALGLQAPAAR
ncbi:MAG TPA: glycoside hydrolase family 5 protein [Terriglobales bacterium]|nr:glycoside hydrolase family 5 protein [Terriglobales bacterium]